MGAAVGKLLRYLSFQGRTNRTRFWLTGLGVWLGALVGLACSRVLMFAVWPPLQVLALPLFVIALIASLANSVKRLHDRNRSAWWLLLFLGLPTVLSLPSEIAKAAAQQDAMTFGALCALLGLPFSLWGLVEMGFLKGSVGPNKYGDDPLAPPVAEVFA